MVRKHNYEALYEHQIAERQTFRYPPFYRFIRIQLRDHNGIRVQRVATQLQAYLNQVFGTRVSGVITPSIERVQAYTIRELTLRIENGANIAEAKRRLSEAIEQVCSMPSNKNTKLILDIDPI